MRKTCKLRGFAIEIARDFRKNTGGNVLAIIMFSFNHRYCSRLHNKFSVESSNVDGVPKEVGGVGPARPAVVQYEIFAPDVWHDDRSTPLRHVRRWT
jgi:hypothetical protein